MEFNDVLHKRHSTRRFTDQQIKTNTLREIIRDAQRAPSWLDAQETRVYIATGETTKIIRKAYEDCAKDCLIGVSDYTVVHRTECSQDAQRNMDQFSRDMETHLGGKIDDFVHAQDDLFFAPTLVFLTLPKNATKWAIMDLGAFQQTLLLSAASRGIGSIVAYSIIKHPDVIRKYLPIPDTEDIAAGIALGYEDKAHRINSFHAQRMPLDSILVLKK